MKLADFIEAQKEKLLQDWAEQATRLGVAQPRPNASELEDSARQLMEQIVEDMRQPESDEDRDAKGLGQRPEAAPGVTEVARAHAEKRLAQGMSLRDLIAEYRSLRASVIRHWLTVLGNNGGTSLHELVRFDESIDQALTESVACYSAALDRTRDLFVGILAHDLRTPLGAISASAQFLLRVDDLPQRPLQVAANIHQSSERMRIIIQDLVDFTRSRLGGSLSISVGPTHLGKLCEHAIAEMGALHPSENLRWTCSGDLKGLWDSSRISELIINLLENAIDHGRAGGEIAVAAEGHSDTVSLLVSNEGDPIPHERIRTIFDPLKRSSHSSHSRRAGAGLGLGLFIAREIAAAHGGTIGVSSTDRTTFTVTLPRAPQQEHATR